MSDPINDEPENKTSILKWSWGAFILSPIWYWYHDARVLALAMVLVNALVLGICGIKSIIGGVFCLIIAILNGRFAYRILDAYLGLYSAKK